MNELVGSHIYSCLLSGFRLTTPSASSSKVWRNCAWLGLVKGIVECLILVMWKNRFTGLKSKGSEFIFLVWEITMIHFARFPNSEPSGGVIKSDKARQSKTSWAWVVFLIKCLQISANMQINFSKISAINDILMSSLCLRSGEAESLELTSHLWDVQSCSQKAYATNLKGANHKLFCKSYSPQQIIFHHLCKESQWMKSRGPALHRQGKRTDSNIFLKHFCWQ